jgi:hypothetical protein
MVTIIKLLEEGKTLSSYKISRKTGSCLADAREVTRMLYYLTSFGKIISNGTGEWKILVSKKNDEIQKNFRLNYIKDLVTLIQHLEDSYKSIDDLASELPKNEKEIRDMLSLLSRITHKGQIKVDGSGFNQNWSLEDWKIS